MAERIAREIIARDSVVRSVRNCYEFTEREAFQQYKNIDGLIERLEYVQTVFERFRASHDNLIQLATDQQEMAEIEEYHDLFDRMEETYLTTKTRLSGRLRYLERPLEPVEPLIGDNDEESGSDNDSEIGQIPNGQQNLAAPEQEPQNGENLQDNANEVEQNIGNANEQNNGIRNAQQPPPLQPMAGLPPGYYPMQPYFIQCHENSRASGKIENTWGEFDGTYSKW